jgi:phosphoglycolate phosphatase-like HAD superfamily hydrolase
VPPAKLTPIRVLITDLDNTLFDWLGFWHASFSAMLRRIEMDSGVPSTILRREFREVHQRHGTVEYAFSIEELPSLQRLHPGADLRAQYATAIEAFRTARREHLRLYAGVKAVLTQLHETGCKIVGYTESFAFYSAYRIRKLDLDLLLDDLYSPEDHDLPAGRTPDSLRRYPVSEYGLRRTVHHHTPRGARKPNPDLLLSIVKGVGARPADVAYVGDSLVKDVMMAQQAGVIDVWAKYGVAQNRSEYELLRAVSAWTDAEVERERKISQSEVHPSHVLENGFPDLFGIFDFQSAASSGETNETR